MAKLGILIYPDPRLRTRAAEVVSFDDEVRVLVRDLTETMYAAPGIGLAATQVNRPQRIIVLDVSEARDSVLVLINPCITHREGKIVSEERCLSVPSFVDNVERARKISVQYQDVDGNPHCCEATDLLAVCIQHEMDHLVGKIFLDYSSYGKRSRFDKKFLKKAKSKGRSLLH